jgi:hypothetical protein
MAKLNSGVTKKTLITNEQLETLYTKVTRLKRKTEFDLSSPVSKEKCADFITLCGYSSHRAFAHKQ